MRSALRRGLLLDLVKVCAARVAARASEPGQTGEDGSPRDTAVGVPARPGLASPGCNSKQQTRVEGYLQSMEESHDIFTDVADVCRRVKSAYVFVDLNVSRCWPNLDLSGAAAVVPVTAQPTRAAALAAAKELRELPVAPSSIVTIGGGSTHDMGKLAAFALATSTIPDDFVWADDVEPIPIVAVPTTFGTGAEYSPVAVHHGRRGTAVGGPKLRPYEVLVVPEFLGSLPSAAIAACALDGVAHALEARLSSPDDPEICGLVAEAVRNYGALGCPDALATEESREIARAGTGESSAALRASHRSVPHALAAALGMTVDISHGHAVGIAVDAFRHSPMGCKVPELSTGPISSLVDRALAALPPVDPSVFASAADTRLAMALHREFAIGDVGLEESDCEIWAERLIDAILRSADGL
jgi:hypothetical protein